MDSKTHRFRVAKLTLEDVLRAEVRDETDVIDSNEMRGFRFQAGWPVVLGGLKRRLSEIHAPCPPRRQHRQGDTSFPQSQMSAKGGFRLGGSSICSCQSPEKLIDLLIVVSNFSLEWIFCCLTRASMSLLLDTPFADYVLYDSECVLFSSCDPDFCDPEVLASLWPPPEDQGILESIVSLLSDRRLCQVGGQAQCLSAPEEG